MSVLRTNPPSARGSECPASGRSSDSGRPPSPPSRPAGQWQFGAGASPLTAAGPSRTCTGFPLRSPSVVAPSMPLRAGGRPALGSRRRLGGCDLRLLGHPEPRHGARHVGPRAAEDRPRDGVRDPRGPTRSRPSQPGVGDRDRDRVRGLGRDPPVVRVRTPGRSPGCGHRRGRGRGRRRAGLEAVARRSIRSRAGRLGSWRHPRTSATASWTRCSSGLTG